MCIGTIANVKLRVDPLLLALCVPAAVFGMLSSLLVAFVCVFVHEMAHVLVARLLGVKTQSISLMPFGGVAQMERAPSGRSEFFIALAGPAANLLMVQILLWVFPNQYSPALSLWVQSNLAIGLFNLLPAVPLDGGRMLCACLRPIVGMERAKRISCYLGMAMGTLIVGAAVSAWVQTARINLSLIGIGALLLVSAYQRNANSMYGAMKQAEQKRVHVRRTPMARDTLTAYKDMQATQVVKRLRRGAVSSIEVVDDAMNPLGNLTETQLLQGIVDLGHTCTLQKILDHVNLYHVK